MTFIERLKNLFSSKDVQATYQDGYSAGEINPRNQAWRPPNRTADAEIKKNFDLLTARSRWLGRNNPWCKGASRCLVNNIIGQGARTKACVRDSNGKLLRDWNKQADALFDLWQEQADVTGRMNWDMMRRTNLFQTIESGEGFLIESADNNPNRLVPICFELIEAEQIDTSLDRPAGNGVNEIRRGIEFDSVGRRVNYHFWSKRPGEIYSGPLERMSVPAWRVIHLFAAERPTQTRGVSWFAPIVTALWDSYEYMQSEISAAKVASFFVYMLKKEGGGTQGLGLVDEDGDDAPTDEFGNTLAPLGPGIGLQGSPQDSLEVIQSNRPNSNSVPWLKFLLQMMGQGLGLSFQRFTGDFSQTTFSSARAADLQDRKGFIPLQRWHAWYVDQEVRRRVTRQFIASGLLTISSGGLVRFERNQARWLACKTISPGWAYVDPEKQVAASRDAIAAGLSTWEIELGELGLDRDEVFETLAEEVKLIKELKLPFDQILGQASPKPGKPAQDKQQDAKQPEAAWEA